MTSQELNKGVAKALGLDTTTCKGRIAVRGTPCFCPECFNPAEDERTAVWSWKQYCKEHGVDAYLSLGFDETLYCRIGIGIVVKGEFCEAIGGAIIEAAKGRG